MAAPIGPAVHSTRPCRRFWASPSSGCWYGTVHVARLATTDHGTPDQPIQHAPPQRGVLARDRFRFTEIAELLAVNHPPRVLQDPLWWLVTAGGSSIALLFWWLVPVDSAGALPRSGWLWLGVIVWQPLIEELLFRGLIQGQLLHNTWGRKTSFGISAANLLTSLLFVALHLLHHVPLWAIAVLPPSLIFGWLRERHKNTWSPFVTHAVYNLAFFVGAAVAAG